MKTIKLALIVLSFLTYIQPSLAIVTGELKSVHGTQIKLTKPDGFEDATNFSGFLDRKTGSSIMVTEMPGAFTEVTAGFTADGLKTKGMQLISKEELKFDSYPAVLINVSQSAGTREFKKWIFAFGSESKTVLITGSYPKEQEGEMSILLKNTLLSANWDKSIEIKDLQADLTYNLPSTPDLKMAGRLQNCLVYTPDGNIKNCSTFFMVAQSISEIGVVDKSDFTYKRLLKIETIKDLKIKSQDDVVINDLPGREIIATAITKKYHTPIMIYTLVLFGSKTYYIMQGQTPLEEASKYEPIFKSMSCSFRSK